MDRSVLLDRQIQEFFADTQAEIFVLFAGQTDYVGVTLLAQVAALQDSKDVLVVYLDKTGRLCHGANRELKSRVHDSRIRMHTSRELQFTTNNPLEPAVVTVRFISTSSVPTTLRGIGNIDLLIVERIYNVEQLSQVPSWPKYQGDTPLFAKKTVIVYAPHHPRLCDDNFSVHFNPKQANFFPLPSHSLWYHASHNDYWPSALLYRYATRFIDYGPVSRLDGVVEVDATPNTRQDTSSPA